MSCVHTFAASAHDKYEVCVKCSTLHSLAPLPPKDIYGAFYWSEKHGHSTIFEQQHNVDVHCENGITKNQFVLSLIRRPNSESALEIACAPGNLLKRLREDAGFKRVVGAEANADYESEIREIARHDGELIFGLFPFSTATVLPESFDLIVGLDVFEHSPEPEPFLSECRRLLKSGGQLILMLPLIGDDIFDARFLHPIEHVFLHSYGNMSEMLWDSGFAELDYSRWTVGHEAVSAIKL